MFYWALIRAWCEENGWDYEYIPMQALFEKYESQIRAMFTPGIPPTIDRVSIHVRRGDYVDNPVLYLLPLEYYRQAMAMFPQERFLVFSDDIDWCTEQRIFRQDNCEFVYETAQSPFDRREGAVADLNRMAACKHNIVANSCFSWWAAWLNPNPDKRVVSPKIWDRRGNSPAWPGWTVIDNLNLLPVPQPIKIPRPDMVSSLKADTAPPAPTLNIADPAPYSEAPALPPQKQQHLECDPFTPPPLRVLTVCLPGAGFEPGLPFMGWIELYAWLLLHNFRVYVSTDFGSNLNNLRNKLLKAITGTETEYVLTIDHDQVASIEAFQLLLDSLDQNPDIDVAAGWTYMQQRGDPMLCSVGTDADNWVTPQGMAEAGDGLFGIAKTGLPFVLIRTSLLVKMAPSPFKVRTVQDEKGEAHAIGEDTGFCMTAREFGARMACHTKAYVPHIKPQPLEPKIQIPSILRSRMASEEISEQEANLHESGGKATGMKQRERRHPLISLIHPTARLNFHKNNNWGKAQSAWFENCDKPYQVQYILVVHKTRWDDFDSDLCDQPIFPWAEVAFIQNTGLDTNISQVNRGWTAATGTVLIGMMDDLFPPPHWDTLLLDAIPDLDAPCVVHASSGSPRDAEPLINAGCCTRAWYDRLGYCVHPDYEECSMFADNDGTAQAYAAGVVIPRFEGPDAIVFDHRHPAFKKGEMDEVYAQHNAPENYAKGRAIFEKRKAMGFPK
jgi:hypothetical protein